MKISTFFAAGLLAFAMAMPAFAADKIIKVKASGDVSKTMDNLEAAVKKAGATVFARVDHAAGAKKAGMELGDEQLLIFGNPKLGTPAMKENPLAGLYLPMRVLVYSDDKGQTWLAYEDPKAMLGELSIPADAPYVQKMTGALGKLTGMASGM